MNFNMNLNLTPQTKKIGGIVIGLIILLMILKTITGSGGISSIADVIDTGSNLNVGTYELIINNTEQTKDNLVAYPIFKINGYTDGSKQLISLSIDNDNNISEANEFLLITDDGVYVNSITLNNFVIRAFNINSKYINSSNGKWALITNDFTEDNKLAYIELYNLFSELIKAGTSDIEPTVDNTFFSINITDNETIATICTNIANCLKDNKETFVNTLNNIIAPLDPTVKIELLKMLSNNFSGSAETEYLVQIIDNCILKFETIANNSSSTDQNQLISFSTSYNQTIDNTDSFSENIVFKYADKGVVKNYNISFNFNQDLTITNIQDIKTEDIASEKNIKGVNDILRKIIKYDFSQLLSLDSTEEDITEFDVLVKDDLIICSDINETYTRKVVYLTNGNKIEDIAIIVLCDNNTVSAAFKDYYTKAGYKNSINYKITTGLNEKISSEINSTIRNNAFIKNGILYTATAATLKTINDSITTIDNFVLSIKGDKGGITQ